MATDRYFVAAAAIWEDTDGVTWKFVEVTEAAFEKLKKNDGDVLHDLSYDEPWVQFDYIVIDGNNSDQDIEDALDGEKPIDFGEDPLVKEFDSLQDMMRAASGDTVHVIQVVVSQGG
jgi:hypothetical protein